MIEHGIVTPEDLVVSFTEGMLVVDEIQGIAYTADRDGVPVPGTTEELIGANAVTSAVADRGSGHPASGTRGSSVRVSLLVASSVLLIAAVTIVALTRRKAKRQSVVLR